MGQSGLPIAAYWPSTRSAPNPPMHRASFTFEKSPRATTRPYQSLPLPSSKFSPDSAYLLFSNPEGIWLGDADGTILTLLAEGSEPAWQPKP